VAALVGASCSLMLSPGKRALGVLKNRTTVPLPEEVDPAVSLAAMLQPGDDRTRWSHARAARIEGVVVAVEQAGIESANGFSPFRRDIHVDVAETRDAAPNRRVIVEVTPPMRDRARARGVDWSVDALRAKLVGRHVRFTGWLLFDSEHADEAENTNPGGRDNWRATAWEIHPVTDIVVAGEDGLE
jgi:hypothetical protein